MGGLRKKAIALPNEILEQIVVALASLATLKAHVKRATTGRFLGRFPAQRVGRHRGRSSGMEKHGAISMYASLRLAE